jgi:hypothetical protein
VFLYLLGIESTDSWLSVRLTGALLGQVHLTHDPLGNGFLTEDASLGIKSCTDWAVLVDFPSSTSLPLHTEFLRSP